MPMNQIIQQKRRALGLTQEQMAAQLGVSAPAVNKWERGVTCPDIALLAPLARLLRTDLNELLGFHAELTQQEIGQLCNALADTYRQSGLEAAFAQAQDKLREYPTCGWLLYSFTTLLEGCLLMSELTAEQKAPYEATLHGWYEQLTQSSDEKLRASACYMLSGKYLRQGDFDKAQQMADALPDRSALDKQLLQANILAAQGKPGEAAALLERRVLNTATELQNLLLRLAELEQDAQAPQTAAAIAEIARRSAVLLELWPYNFYVAPFTVALQQQDAGQALPLLRALLAALFEPWETQDSPLYHRNADKLGVQAGASLLPPLLTELETGPQYDFLRDNSEFKALLDAYRAKCGDGLPAPQ